MGSDISGALIISNGLSAQLARRTFRTEDKLSDTDVTFFGISDLHYSGPDSSKANQDLIKLLNAFPEPLIRNQLGCNVATARGVVLTGDITDAGKLNRWEAFTADYGVNADASLVYPMYELWGNHDGRSDGVVAQGIKMRDPSVSEPCHDLEKRFPLPHGPGKVHFTSVNIYPGRFPRL